MRIHIISLVGLCFLVFASCSESRIDPGKVISDELSDDATFGRMRAGGDEHRALLTAYRAITKFSPDRIIQQDVAQVSLENADSGRTVYGGNVYLNGTELRALRLPEGPTRYQSIQHNVSPQLQIVPLSFDGGYQVFRVQGNSSFPAFADSLKSPVTTVDIAEPQVEATLSKSAGFTVRWTGTSGHDLTYITISGNGPRGFGRKVTGENSITITPLDIAGLNPGEMNIIVTSGDYKGTVSGGIGRLVAVYSSMAIETQLTP
jgi:hypothetical protein